MYRRVRVPLEIAMANLRGANTQSDGKEAYTLKITNVKQCPLRATNSKATNGHEYQLIITKRVHERSLVGTNSN